MPTDDDLNVTFDKLIEASQNHYTYAAEQMLRPSTFWSAVTSHSRHGAPFPLLDRFLFPRYTAAERWVKREWRILPDRIAAFKDPYGGDL